MRLSLPKLNNPRVSQWVFVLLAGVTLFYVLYVFEGFGIQQGISYSGHGFLYRTVVFGLANSCIYYLFEFHIIRFYNIDSLQQKVIFALSELMIGGTATFLLFNYFWNWTEWGFYPYALLLAEYTSVMIVPLVIKEFLQLNNRKLNQGKIFLKFASDNGKDEIKVIPDDLLYLKSSGNYIEVQVLTNKGVQTKLIRNTLRKFEKTYQGHPHLIRCHRSYLINPAQIKKVYRKKGKLELELIGAKIPLSRQYEQNFNF